MAIKDVDRKKVLTIGDVGGYGEAKRCLTLYETLRHYRLVKQREGDIGNTYVLDTEGVTMANTHPKRLAVKRYYTNVLSEKFLPIQDSERRNESLISSKNNEYDVVAKMRFYLSDRNETTAPNALSINFPSSNTGGIVSAVLSNTSSCSYVTIRIGGNSYLNIANSEILKGLAPGETRAVILHSTRGDNTVTRGELGFSHIRNFTHGYSSEYLYNRTIRYEGIDYSWGKGLIVLFELKKNSSDDTKELIMSFPDVSFYDIITNGEKYYSVTESKYLTLDYSFKIKDIIAKVGEIAYMIPSNE